MYRQQDSVIYLTVTVTATVTKTHSWNYRQLSQSPYLCETWKKTSACGKFAALKSWRKSQFNLPHFISSFYTIITKEGI